MQDALSLLPQHHSEKKALDAAQVTVDPELEIGNLDVPSLPIISLTRFEVDALRKLLEKQPCGEFSRIYEKVQRLSGFQ